MKPVKGRGQRTLTELEELVKVQYEADTRDVMSSPAGRRFVWSLCMSTCNLLGRSFTASGSETFFNEGRRAVGSHVYAEVLRLAPVESVLMYQEATERQQTEAIQRELASRTDDTSP